MEDAQVGVSRWEDAHVWGSHGQGVLTGAEDT
jgi:hypothetical protein